MVPRTIRMAAEVAATFTPPQLEDYGNIILNGYATTGPNTLNKKAWQYKETLTPPVDLPSITSVRPALKGWTNNYQEYYTQLPPNSYSVNSGDPTMFNYTVHSYDSAGDSKWAQAPYRYFGVGFSAALFPKADNLVAPPIGIL
jgi:hypothetical protein